MRRSVLGLFLTVPIWLSGCGSSDQPWVQTQTSRVNTLVVTDSSPNATFQGAGHPVEHVSARGFDSAGQPVWGPFEETYDEEMIFSGLPDTVASVHLDYNRGQGYTLARHEQQVDFPSDDDGVIHLNDVSPRALGATRASFTVRIVNTSAYPDDQVYLTVLGKNSADTHFYYVKFGAGDNNSSVPMGPVDQFSSYSQQLSLLKSEGEHRYSFQCPYQNLVSGRIYLSFGTKLKGLGLNNPSDGLSLQLPSASGAPDYQTVYEFMELSATAGPNQDYTLYANTSVVDFFSLGLGMTMDYHQGGANRSESVGFVADARAKILAEFEKSTTPTEFRNYIRRNGESTILRVLSPVQKLPLEPNGPLASFLDPALNSGWTHYAGTALEITDNLAGALPYGYSYTGQLIVGGVLSMTCTQKPAGDTAGGVLESLGEVCNLAKPTSRIVFDCDDSSGAGGPDKDSYRNAGSHGHRRLISLLGAALNRGVFENYADWANPAKFYTRADGRYNHYSKIMHLFALNAKVYGFGYDDVYGQDPTLAKPLPEVNQIVITIPAIPVL